MTHSSSYSSVSLIPVLTTFSSSTNNYHSSSPKNYHFIIIINGLQSIGVTHRNIFKERICSCWILFKMKFTNTFIAIASAALVTGSPIDCGDPIVTHNAQLVGDGDPHQNFIWKQVSATTDCTDNPAGSAAITESTTVGWSAGGTFVSDFISAGFDVSESTTTGTTNAFGCKKSDTDTYSGSLCVFERIQTTAYTVNQRTCTESGCGSGTCSPYTGNVVLVAPNSNQGSCFFSNFQANQPCGPQGQEITVPSGPAGGPQDIPCDPVLPAGA